MLQRVTEVTKGYRGLKGDTRTYIGLQGVTEG